MTKLIILCCLLGAVAFTSAQRITTIHLDGVQYFISRMNPYSPELNYFLAYQYCRSLGLQLASFETKEKAESMTTYLKNAGYGNYDFWTSGNRLGTGMFLWMSTGLPFNATFDFFENSVDAMQAGLLDPVDHNSNTSPQRTARDSSSGADKGCVILKQPTLKWMPEDCSAVKDFICEQTRCYYYNYGSIPVSSAQGRPIRATTPHPVVAAMNLHPSTTPLPIIMSTYATFAKRAQEAAESQQPSLVSLKLDHERALDSVEVELESDVIDDELELHHDDDDSADADAEDAQESSGVSDEHARELNDVKEHVLSLLSANEHDEQEQPAIAAAAPAAGVDQPHVEDAQDDMKGRHSDTAAVASNEDDFAKLNVVAPFANEMQTTSTSAPFERVTAAPVEVRLKQISQEVEQMASGNSGINEKNQYAHNSIAAAIADNDDIGRQSFLSLTDLIRTLRPNDKQIIPQIDSDYSNAMRVLGETSVNNNNN